MILLARLFSIVALTVGMSGSAFAHAGHEAAFGFWSGFLHPFGGLDHVLAMIAVGLLAAQLGGRALWLVPGTFVTVMALAAAAGVSGLPLPGTEYGILLSIVAISLPVAFALGMPVALAMAAGRRLRGLPRPRSRRGASGRCDGCALYRRLRSGDGADPRGGHFAWLGPRQACHGPPGVAYRRRRHRAGRLYSGRCIAVPGARLIIRQQAFS